ncbi:MAG TPA: AAA family ATPase [Polyangiales bacterium]|nr:AAA family ATPase [Polyangiales bacterium]
MGTEQSFSFGEFELDAPAAVLCRRGVPIKLQPKPFAMLVHLLRNRQRVISKSELLEAIWPNVAVSDQALWSVLRDLRRALGDTDTAERTIRTVRGRGIRFIGELRPLPPTASAAPAALEPTNAQPTRQDFLGRDDAMKTLHASLAAADHGELRLSLIAGAAGIGKSRLALELSAQAKGLGFEVHNGRCLDREGATPFWPWLQLLRGISSGARTAATARQIRAELPELRWIDSELPAPEHADLDRAEARFRFFDVVGRFLARMSAAHPLLLIIDDLHWADEASLLLLEFVITALREARIQLIATFRDPPRPTRTLAHVLAVAARHPFTERLDLQGLRRDAVSFLLERAAARLPSPAVVDVVLTATAGNALFVTELAKLAEQGQLDMADPRRGLPVPKRVRDVLHWQFLHLSPNCRRVLRLLSVAGSELDLTPLTHAAHAPQRAVLGWLSEAESAGFVTSAGQPRVGFVHDLVRESIYRDLSLATRTRLHRHVAEALEATALKDSRADLGSIAYHYALGSADGAAERAVHFGRLAGERANARMAYEDAVVNYERALHALPMVEGADPRLACELLLAQAEAAWGTQEAPALVQQRFVAAADAARAAGEPQLLARAALGRTGHRAGPGDFRDIIVVDSVDIALLSEAQTVLGSAESELRALVLARLALALRYARPFEVAEALSKDAVSSAEQLAAPATLAETLRYRHAVLSGPEFVRERLEIAGRMLSLARAVRSRPLELDALNFQARDQFKLLDFVASKMNGDLYDAISATMKHPGALFRSGIRAVVIHMLRGDFARAERDARQFYERDSARNLGAAGTFELQLIMLGMLRGDHDAAIATIRQMAARRPDVPWLECALAREFAFSGRRSEAALLLAALASDGYRRVTDYHQHSSLGAMFLLAEACGELGDARHAEELYPLLLPHEHLMVSPFLGTIWQGSVAHALGMLSVAAARWEQAARHFERALSTARRVGSPPLIAISLHRYAQVLRRGRNGVRARGAELLGEARAIAERIGMQDIA